MPADAVGFWSYARIDDEAEEGRIVRLARLVRVEYELLTGDSLSIFVDRDDLEWGDEWRRRIDEALAGTTFFIPIVTPRFFERPECRRELLTFAGTAKSLNLEDLILPLYYVTVPGIDAGQPTPDEAVSLVTEHQREDWRELRLEDQASALYRQGVNRLAVKLAQIAAAVRERPDIQPGERAYAPGGGSDAGEENEDAEGIVDLLARGEETLPRMVPLIEKVGEVINSVGQLAEGATRRVEMSDQQRKGFAGRLTVSRALAKDLEQPADQLVNLGSEFASVAIDVDPAVLTLIRVVEADPAQYSASEEVRELFRSIKEMARASEEAAGSTEGFVANLDEWAKLSRDLKRPVRRMQQGLRGVMDGNAVFTEWGRLIEQVEAAFEAKEGNG
jgi:hypothetical protein